MKDSPLVSITFLTSRLQYSDIIKIIIWELSLNYTKATMLFMNLAVALVIYVKVGALLHENR